MEGIVAASMHEVGQDPMEKKQPKRKGQDEKEVPKAFSSRVFSQFVRSINPPWQTVRKLAVERLLEAVPREDWLHDGSLSNLVSCAVLGPLHPVSSGGNLLWTRRSVKRFQDHRTQVEAVLCQVASGRTGRRAVRLLCRSLPRGLGGGPLSLSWRRASVRVCFSLVPFGSPW